MEDAADALPEARVIPPTQPVVGGLPRAVGCWEITPGMTAPHDPEDPFQESPVSVAGATGLAAERRQQGVDLLPGPRSQRRRAG
jgi:hypothetical protein